jgi:hypothetical protein
MDIQKDFEKIEMPILSQLSVIYELSHKLVFSFPKHERYALGEKIENSLLQAIELSIIGNGANKYEKEKILLKLNSKLELLKVLFRIALNCKIIETKTYLEFSGKIQEIGKMTQGWIKYARNMQ